MNGGLMIWRQGAGVETYSAALPRHCPKVLLTELHLSCGIHPKAKLFGTEYGE